MSSSPSAAGFEASGHLWPDADRVEALDLDFLVVEVDLPGSRENDVDLLGLLVPMPERVVLVGLDDLVRDAELSKLEILVGEARLLELGEAARDGHVLELAEVLVGVVGHERGVPRAEVEAKRSGQSPAGSTWVRPMSATRSSNPGEAFSSHTREPRRLAASWRRASASTHTASGSTPLDVAAGDAAVVAEDPAHALAEPGRSARVIGPRIENATSVGPGMGIAGETADEPRTQRRMRPHLRHRFGKRKW